VSNGDDHEDGCLLGRETVQFGTQQTTDLIKFYLYQRTHLFLSYTKIT